MKNSDLLAAARSIANPDEIFELREPAEFLWHLSKDKCSDRGIKKAFKLWLSPATPSTARETVLGQLSN
jgi:hypothetical protein